MIAWVILAGVVAQAPEVEAPAEGRSTIVSLEASGATGSLFPLVALSAERVIASHLALYGALTVPLGGLLHEQYLLPTVRTDQRELAGGIRLAARWYLTARAPSGLFVSPLAAASAGRVEYHDVYSNNWLQDVVGVAMELGGALVVGYSGVLDSGLTIQVGGGISAAWRIERMATQGAPLQVVGTAVGVAPMAFLSVGWGF